MEEEKKEKKVSKAKYDALEQENELYKKDVEHWKNEYYRVFADMQNLRKALEKERSEVIKYRTEGFVENLLPILDSFHVALSVPQTDPVLKNYLVGFQYVYKQLVDVLENEGVKQIAPKENDKFDPDTMMAQDTVESDLPKDYIVKVIANGYKLHEHLIAPAKVIVSKGKQEPIEEEKQA